MNEPKDDGGPAFPVPPGNVIQGEGVWEPMSGMSLRDYFAGQAATGAFTEGNTDIDDDVMARRCYELADALLKERAK